MKLATDAPEPTFDVSEALKAIDATLECVATYLAESEDLSSDDLINLTVDFQDRAKAFGKLAGTTKAPVRAAMEAADESERIAASGRKAKFFTSNRTKDDKGAAKKYLTAAQYSAVYSVVPVTTFKVS